jgi:hypothetical protein
VSGFQASVNQVYIRYTLTAVKYDIKNLFEERDNHLFKQILLHPDNCLRGLFPPQRENRGRLLRTRGHKYTLPIVKSSSFVNVCLILSEVYGNFCCMLGMVLS